MGVIRDAGIGTLVFGLVAVRGRSGALAGDVGFWHYSRNNSVVRYAQMGTLGPGGSGHDGRGRSAWDGMEAWDRTGVGVEVYVSGATQLGR